MAKQVIKLTEEDLHRIIKESVNKILSESAKGVDENNVVPQELAEKYHFTQAYSGFKNGLEIWERKYKPELAKELLRRLGIRRFTSINTTSHTCRITVRPKKVERVKKPEYSDSTPRGWDGHSSSKNDIYPEELPQTSSQPKQTREVPIEKPDWFK
jgi:hypothetical protein